MLSLPRLLWPPLICNAEALELLREVVAPTKFQNTALPKNIRNLLLVPLAV